MNSLEYTPQDWDAIKGPPNTEDVAAELQETYTYTIQEQYGASLD